MTEFYRPTIHLEARHHHAQQNWTILLQNEANSSSFAFYF
jgi:hypothetical protein